MLVKLGDVWVDPIKVVMLEPGIKVAVVTDSRSALSTGDINDFASIINNTIGSSYGGEYEQSPEHI